MVILSGSNDPDAAVMFGVPAVLGLAAGFLAWLLGAVGRPGTLGFAAMLLVGVVSGVVLAIPAFSLGVILEKPLAALGFKTLANWSLSGLLIIPLASTVLTLLANAWWSCRRRR